jgi:RHS repeat-associated protein
MELDDSAQIISYEEYCPYGSTSYQALDQAELPKRYRYTAMERDVETGLEYHGARYYAPWIGRWVSADPTGVKDGPNLYAYVSANPQRLTDPSGRGGEDEALNKIVEWSEKLGAKYRGTSASSVELHGILAKELPKDLANDPYVITEAIFDKEGFIKRHGIGPQVGGLPGEAGTYETMDVLVINEEVDANTVALIRSGEVSAKDLVTPVDLKLGGASMTKAKTESVAGRLGSRPLLIGQDGRYHTWTGLSTERSKSARSRLKEIKARRAQIEAERRGGASATTETEAASSHAAADEAAVAGAKVAKATDVVIPSAKVIAKTESTVARVLAGAAKVGNVALKATKFAGEVLIVGDVVKRSFLMGTYLRQGEYMKAFEQPFLFIEDQILINPLDMADFFLSRQRERNRYVPIEVTLDNPYPTGGQWGDPTVMY